MTVTVLALDRREIRITGTGYDATGAFLDNGHELEAASDPHVYEALKIGMLVNHAELIVDGDGVSVRGDPTEGALLVAGQKAGLDRHHLRKEFPQIGEVPFSSERMLMATFHRADEEVVTYAKGAPGRVIDLCDHALVRQGEVRLDNAGRERLLARNHELAARGLRVLALARGRARGRDADEAALKDLTFVGFVGMIDPPAAGVKETIRTFRDAGIRTVMITGDQERTAQAVAEDLGSDLLRAVSTLDRLVRVAHHGCHAGRVLDRPGGRTHGLAARAHDELHDTRSGADVPPWECKERRARAHPASGAVESSGNWRGDASGVPAGARCTLPPAGGRASHPATGSAGLGRVRLTRPRTGDNWSGVLVALAQAINQPWVAETGLALASTESLAPCVYDANDGRAVPQGFPDRARARARDLGRHQGHRTLLLSLFYLALRDVLLPDGRPAHAAVDDVVLTTRGRG